MNSTKIKILIITNRQDEWIAKLAKDLHCYNVKKNKYVTIVSSELFHIQIQNGLGESQRASRFACAIVDQPLDWHIEHNILKRMVTYSVIKTFNAETNKRNF